MDDSLKLAKLWTTLAEVRERIDNVVLPLGGHLGVDAPDLMSAAEGLSDKIAAHFERHKLVAVTQPKKQE